LVKLSRNFALCSDFALVMGGDLKFAEFISGRYADVLSNLFLGYAVSQTVNDLITVSSFDHTR
jgi:hypothetical protein